MASTSSIGQRLGFLSEVASALSNTIASIPPEFSASYKWEAFEDTARRVAQSFSRRKAFSLKQAEHVLQVKRRVITQTICSIPKSLMR